VVFVPNAKIGDKLRIKITTVGRRSAEAEVLGAAKEAGETE
jgi:predicted RNA-binding protein with TRAM domain